MGFIFSFFSKPTLSSAARTRRPVSSGEAPITSNGMATLSNTVRSNNSW